MATWLQDLTPKQADTLKQFRQNVSDVLKPHHDDWYLLRWLRARKYDLKKSEEMLRTSLLWREEYGADRILEWQPPEVLLNYWPGGVYGCDKEGHPILYQLSKDFDPKGMMKSTRKADIVKFYIWRMEKMMKMCEEQSAKLNKKIMGTMHISDLEGFSIGMAFTPGISDAMKEVFALYEANYPENLAKSFIINAPSVFPVIYNILRPFLSEETKRKVYILGRSWQDKMAEVVDADQMPIYWGGTATTENGKDIYCQPHITIGKKVPASLYLTEQLQIDRGKMSQVTVNKHSCHRLQYNVAQPGTVITWVFETDDYDIGFGVYLAARDSGINMNADVTSDKNLQEVVKSERVTSHVAPQDGRITCNMAGKYVLIFDNMYSRMNSKKLYYDVRVLPPAANDILLQSHAQQLREADVSESTHL